MDILKGDNSFYIGPMIEPMAKIIYKVVEDTLYIEHLYINNQLKGQGIGANLVEKTIEYGHENDLKIDPTYINAESFPIETEEDIEEKSNESDI